MPATPAEVTAARIHSQHFHMSNNRSSVSKSKNKTNIVGSSSNSHRNQYYNKSSHIHDDVMQGSQGQRRGIVFGGRARFRCDRCIVEGRV